MTKTVTEHKMTKAVTGHKTTKSVTQHKMTACREGNLDCFDGLYQLLQLEQFVVLVGKKNIDDHNVMELDCFGQYCLAVLVGIMME